MFYERSVHAFHYAYKRFSDGDKENRGGEVMRKLLNTVYVTNEMAYLTLDGENLVCKIDGEIKLRIPFENIENIVCFNYVGCSPALMGKCVGKTIPINFISPQGKF